jgi:ABC-type phosphate transport system substrate-binding protein
MTALMLVLALPQVGASRSAGFKVIVSPNVKGSALSRQVLSAVFLGKAERWGDGSRIVPIDLSSTSPVRATFSEQMLGMPTIAVRRYWEQRLMAGAGSPPMVKASEEEMIAAVASNSGAIGYVSEDLPVPETVKVLPVQ